MNIMDDPLQACAPSCTPESLTWTAPREADGVESRGFRFTFASSSTGNADVYGVFARPDGTERVPAVLHIHGGGQTASPQDVAFWVKRGYACMSFDWTGPKPEREDDHVSRFPYAGDGPQPGVVDSDVPGDCTVMQVARAARECLAVLARMDGVDERRIGAYGISWGGFLTWLVNASAPELSAACSIYGTGGRSFAGHAPARELLRMPPSARHFWMRFCDPAALAGLQRTPMLHLNSTNDFFGGMDVLARTLPRIRVPWRIDLTPNGNHHIGLESRGSLEAWFDHHLRGGPDVPETPALRVERDGPSSLRIVTDAGDPPPELWVSCGSLPHFARCWRRRDAWEDAGDGEAVTALDASGETWLYLRRRGEGASFCSELVCLRLAELPAPDPTGVLYEPGDDRSDGIGYFMAPDIIPAAEPDSYFLRDPEGLTGAGSGAGLQHMELRTPATPEGRAPDGTTGVLISSDGFASLSLQARSAVPGMAETSHVATVEKPPSECLIPPSSFIGPGEQPLESFRDVHSFVVTGAAVDGRRWRIRKICWSGE